MFWLFLKRKWKKKKLGQSSHHGCFLQAFFSGDIASFSKPLLCIIFEETWKDRWVLLQEHWQGKCIGGAMYPKAETQSLTWEVGWAFWRTSSWGIQEGNKQRQAYSPDPGRQKARHNFLGFVIFFIPSPLSGDFLTWATGFIEDGMDCDVPGTLIAGMETRSKAGKCHVGSVTCSKSVTDIWCYFYYGQDSCYSITCSAPTFWAHKGGFTSIFHLLNKMPLMATWTGELKEGKSGKQFKFT